MKPTHYLLVGLPYSGKSTLAQELLKLGNFAHINIDQLKWNRGYKTGDDDVPGHVWEEIFIEADQLLSKYLHDGLNVANEYAWITRDWRDRAKKVAIQCGCVTTIIYIKIPREAILNRWQSNAESKTRFQWPEKEMQGVFSDFEEPTQDENFIVYDQNISAAKWIQQNIPIHR